MNRLETINVAGKDALAELDRLRAEAQTTGIRPIILGEPDGLELLEEGMEEDFDVAEILAMSEDIAVPDWFRAKIQSESELYQAEEGDWTDESGEEMGIVTHLDITSGKPLKQVVIGLLRIASPWQAFAALNYGGWNDCPFPQEHCAVQRYWASQYGAEVVSITSDVVQCIVARPPMDRESALRLAHEQYAYCYDIVDQGTGSIAALAAGLVDSKFWYFWWD